MNDILNFMCDTIISQLYGYNAPDDSDYTEYLYKTAIKAYETIIKQAENYDLFTLSLCWSMFEGCNIHNFIKESCSQQIELSRYIAEKAKIKSLNSDDIKYNTELLGKIKEAYSRTDKENKAVKVLHFVSYCMFANRTLYGNDNNYWNQINYVILKEAYLSYLNGLSSQFWIFPPTQFMCGNGGPIPVGPNEMHGPKFEQATEGECKGEYVSYFYLPQQDSEAGIGLSVKPVEPIISIEEMCNWVTLDYIVKKESYNNPVPMRLLCNTKKQPCCKRGIRNLILTCFTDNKTEVLEVFRDILYDLYCFNEDHISEDLSVKCEFGSFESNPGIVYCIYKLFNSLKTVSVKEILPNDVTGTLINEYDAFSNFIKSNQNYNRNYADMLSNFYTDKAQEQLQKISANADKDKTIYLRECSDKERYKLGCMMYYFFMWDFASNLEPENGLSDLTLLDFFKSYVDLHEMFYTPFSKKDWTEQKSFDRRERYTIKCLDAMWTDSEYLLGLYNRIYSVTKINRSQDTLIIDAHNTEKIENKMEYLRTMLYNFGDISNRSKDKILNVMDYVGELKERSKLYCQPQSSKKITKTEAELEIDTLKSHHETLRKYDCGFELDNHMQFPAPMPFNDSRRFMLSRSITCKFFSDTDKLYKYTHDVDDKHPKAPLKYNEDYRKTNASNLTSHCLYVAERNTERHYIKQYSIQSILNESYPLNLLEAMYDAKEYLELQLSKKKDEDEKLILGYQLDFLNRHLKTYAEKFDLIKADDINDIWDIVFTNDKNVRQNIIDILPKEIDYEEVFGKLYVSEITWFFNIMYCNDEIFLNQYYNKIALYLTYLGSELIQMY